MRRKVRYITKIYSNRKPPKKGDIILIHTTTGEPYSLSLVTYKIKNKIFGIRIPLRDRSTNEPYVYSTAYKDTVLKNNSTEKDLEAYAAAMRIL
jgi:hypothetical protein